MTKGALGLPRASKDDPATKATITQLHEASSLSILEYARHSAHDILWLREQAQQRRGNARAMQRLPKWMRRRQASHSPRRVPRRLREKAFWESQQDPPRSRRPRVWRRRYGRALSDTDESDYGPLHVWHAKRFHMAHLYGYRVADTPTRKCQRHFWRVLTSQAVVFDLHMLRLHDSDRSPTLYTESCSEGLLFNVGYMSIALDCRGFERRQPLSWLLITGRFALDCLRKNLNVNTSGIPSPIGLDALPHRVPIVLHGSLQNDVEVPEPRPPVESDLQHFAEATDSLLQLLVLPIECGFGRTPAAAYVGVPCKQLPAVWLKLNEGRARAHAFGLKELIRLCVERRDVIPFIGRPCAASLAVETFIARLKQTEAARSPAHKKVQHFWDGNLSSDPVDLVIFRRHDYRPIKAGCSVVDDDDEHCVVGAVVWSMTSFNTGHECAVVVMISVDVDTQAFSVRDWDGTLHSLVAESRMPYM